MEAVTEPSLLYTKADGIARITFNRPQVHNAVDPEALCRLAMAWQDVVDDDSVRVVVLTGAGDRAFTAGADLGTLIPLLNGARQPEDEWDERVLAEPSCGSGPCSASFPSTSRSSPR